MYKVNFRDLSTEEHSLVVVAQLDDVVKACSLALNLHQISNLPHSVTVTCGSEYDVTLILTTADNGNKS